MLPRLTALPGSQQRQARCQEQLRPLGAGCVNGVRCAVEGGDVAPRFIHSRMLARTSIVGIRVGRRM
jgi:hypothetical protein